MPEHHFFVTGTDTDVGKTTVTAALALALDAEGGITTSVMKPIQTGCSTRSTGLDAPDLSFALQLLTQKDTPDHAPYRYIPACSPHLAAQEAQETISTPIIVQSYARLCAKYDALVVEGAGGVLVPINDDQSMLDVMKLINIPIILTARPGLGTINHSLLSIRVLQAAGLTVSGIVYVSTNASEWTAIEKDNVQTISRISGVPCLGEIPYFPDLDLPAKAKPFLLEHGQQILKKIHTHG